MSELLGNKISNADEEEVEEELAALEAEAARKVATKTATSLPDAPDTHILPSAPQTVPGEAQQDVLQQQQAAKVGEGRTAVLAS